MATTRTQKENRAFENWLDETVAYEVKIAMQDAGIDANRYDNDDNDNDDDALAWNEACDAMAKAEANYYDNLGWEDAMRQEQEEHRRGIYS